MTKDEAILEMKQGNKVTHRFFSDDEWMCSKDGYIEFEDGCQCSFIEFWQIRTDSYWEDDWKLFE